MAAKPITISITFVEVATVTGSFLLIAQATSTGLAQQHVQQLNATGSVANSALTTAVATVYQTWLVSATSGYVEQLTSTLGASAATVAASNTLRLGLFSSVRLPDVTVLSAVIDQNVTAALNTNSSDAVQNYAYNVTLQVAILTADMLLSVFVDVLNSTGYRRRLLSRTDLMADSPPTVSASGLQLWSPHRRLQQSTSSAAFPLASLLQFKMDLVLAAFMGTSGCSTDSVTDLFYQDQDPPVDLATLCGGDYSAVDRSLDSALLAGANSSVPLLQVRFWSMLHVGCSSMQG